VSTRGHWDFDQREGTAGGRVELYLVVVVAEIVVVVVVVSAA
jgi:hypothetical protein